MSHIVLCLRLIPQSFRGSLGTIPERPKTIKKLALRNLEKKHLEQKGKLINAQSKLGQSGGHKEDVGIADDGLFTDKKRAAYSGYQKVATISGPGISFTN